MTGSTPSRSARVRDGREFAVVFCVAVFGLVVVAIVAFLPS